MVLLTALFLMTAVQIGLPGIPGARPGFVDFHVFHLAGTLALSGELSTAYHTADFAPLQAAQPGYAAYMPYTYPPPFNLLAAALALLPQGIAYLALIGGSFAALLLVLRRLCGTHATAVLMMLLPAAIVSARFGQNGFLTAALIGAACLWWPRAQSGLPLGAMIVKPHLALGLGLAALLRFRWLMIVVAAATALTLAALATLAFGTAVWTDFRDAARESGQFLNDGAYPMFRMTSVYACARSLGLASGAAMSLHIALAAVSVAALALASARGWQPRRILTLAVLSCLMISPYAYDYDLTLGTVALALAAPDLARTPVVPRLGLTAALWFASGWGLAMISFATAPKSDIPSLGAPGVLLASALIFRTLHRAETAATRLLPA
ncbi:hypothetical protein ATO6_19225 [Oceanicola sp. 22II-s10i]|nr:hypothetical protein ATO6_19225 [Oceanicola sp. 22II-s10i]